MQNSLKKSFSLSGKGLHSGKFVNVNIFPASADYGIWFKRVDLKNEDPLIPALFDMVSETKLCTKISNSEGASVQTIEHLMAAFAGTGIHNALVEIDGPELPILDGSAMVYVKEILNIGLVSQKLPIRGYKVLKEVSVIDGKSWASLKPSSELSINFEIDYSDTFLGWQSLELNMKNGCFVRELCDSRTFCRSSEIPLMRKKGLALGGSLENAIVIENDHILNEEGLRYNDECVRHKMLDAMGDLSLLGGPLIGSFSASCGGHALTNKLLHKTFEDISALKPILIKEKDAINLPGFGICESDINRLNKS